MARRYLLVCAILDTPSRSKLATARKTSQYLPDHCGPKADELRLGVVMGLREGLPLIRGMRRALTKEEQHKIAGKMFEHLESTNWKIERGRPLRGMSSI